jgi:cadmium resistance protein CadD (predicted permease)
MTTRHTFSESRKRFEPIEKKCAFCSVNHATSFNDNFYVPLFKEQDRTNVVVYRSVKFNKILMGIPRCSACLDIHRNADSSATTTAWFFAVVVFIVSFLIWGLFGLLSFLPCIFIVFFGKTYYEDSIVKRKGIITEMDGAKNDPTVQEVIISGWSFEQPAA